MELDLDSFLESHTDDEDDDHLLHHRTVDEILLNHSSSSSSSPSPPSSPSVFHGCNYEYQRNHFVDSSSKSLATLQLELHSAKPTAESGNSKQSSEFSSPPAGQSLLPQFFSGVIRSNSKPGDALAAAVAASRSVPAPRAASIKSRKASPRVLQRVLEGDESASVAPPARTDTDDGSRTTDLELERKDQFQAAQLQLSVTEDTSREVSTADVGQDDMSATDGDAVSEVDEFSNKSNLKEAPGFSGTCVESPARTEKDLIFHGSSALDEIEDRHAQSISGGEYNVVSADSSLEAATKEILSSPLHETLSDEDSTKKVGAEHEHENGTPQSKEGEVSSHGDESDSLNDAASIIEELVLQQESVKDSTKTQKEYFSALKPLELAEEAEKKQASAGMHLEEGAAAQPMRLDGVLRGSNVLGYFDVDDKNTITQTLSSQAFRREHGSSQVLAVNLNYIAVGMSKGSILVMPSRYSPHHADDMDSKMLMFGSPGDRSHVPVTSLSFNPQGDLLFAGYGDGHYIVWDVQRASVLKVVTEHHKAPVVHLFYVGQDSTRKFNVLSGDTKGVVKLSQFMVYPLFNRISLSKSQELLNESNRTTVCAVPLLSGESYGGAMVASSEGGSLSLMEENVVMLGTHQSALVAKLSPAFKVYSNVLRPDGVREGSMPYAAWKSESMPIETSEKVSLLAIAWDQRVQVAKLVKSELKVCWKWTTDSSAVGLAWLDEQILVILTATGQLCLFSKDGNLIHRRGFSMDGSCGDDLMSYHAYFSNAFGNPEKAHHNCIGVRGATLYILRPSQLLVSRLLSWKERIEVLHKAGDWSSALNMAMSLYDGQAHAVIDLPRDLDDVRKTLIPYLVQLLLSYVDEVFSYIAVASGNQRGQSGQSNESKDDADFVHPDIKEQYTRVGGVSVEFCLHIKRIDVLFDEIFPKFDAVNHKDTFLELLEPYILKDMLGSLPPEIMQALVEHYSTNGWLQRVEQCVLHMDMLSLDFNQIVRLCREHRLHGALIYLFNKGLDDFRTPLEELFLILRDSKGESATSLGYKMLVYLKYCFQGLAFPPGRGTLPSNRVPSLKRELVQFLLEEASSPNSSTAMCLPYSRTHPNLLSLLELDTEATLDVLRYAFVEGENESHSPEWNPSYSKLETTEVEISTVEGENLVQKVVDLLAVIVDTSYFQTGGSFNDERCTDVWPTRKDIEFILDFIAFFIAVERAKASKDTLRQIFEYLTLGNETCLNVSGQIVETLNRRQRQLTAVLEVLPEEDWDAHYLMNLCERAQLHQVCGLIHAIRHQYLSALDSYMKAADEPILAFIFIDDMLRQPREKESDAFRSAVISRIPELIKLSREGTFSLIVNHLREENDNILSQLRSHPESLFLYLKALIEVHLTGTLNFSSLRKDNASEFPCGRKKRHMSSEVYLETLSDLPKVLQNLPIHLTDELTELYIELLCRYERKSVLRFLETFESYRVDHCLRLCQEYGILDAAAFLFERVGETGSALLLVISALDEKFSLLDTALESEHCDADPEHFKAILTKKEVTDILDILRTCIGLCQRNSPRLEPDEAESLWFQLLDSFCAPLVDSCDHSKIRYKDESTGLQEGEQACKIQWKVSKSHRNAHILRKLFSVFIKEIVEGMIGYVSLPRIILKLLSDNETQEFGDFKPTLLGMLGTYDFERQILDTAKSLIEDDQYSSLSLLKREASHGFAPRSLQCCICNGPLTKDFSGSSILIFSCGHAMHLQCEPQENEASFRGNTTGCPICLPRKSSERPRSKSMLAENGLVKTISKSHRTHGMTALYPQENDGFDNSYGLQSISRFDLLVHLQKNHQSMQIENIPQLRLAPPAVYHEKVKKRNVPSTGESSNGLSKMEKPSRSRNIRDIKLKGSSLRFPLKSNIFGKERSVKL